MWGQEPPASESPHTPCPAQWTDGIAAMAAAEASAQTKTGSVAQEVER